MKIGYRTLLPLALIIVSAVVIVLVLRGPLSARSSSTSLTGTWVEVRSSHVRVPGLGLSTLQLEADGRFLYVGPRITWRGKWKVARPSMIRLEFGPSGGRKPWIDWITLRGNALCFDNGFMIQEICFHRSQSS
jgi:hypothetical protein